MIGPSVILRSSNLKRLVLKDDSVERHAMRGFLRVSKLNKSIVLLMIDLHGDNRIFTNRYRRTFVIFTTEKPQLFHLGVEKFGDVLFIGSM